MTDVHKSDETAFQAQLAFHRRQMDGLTPPAFKDQRFDGAKQMVVDLLEGRKTDITSETEPIEFKAVNTDAQELFPKT